LFFSSVVAAAAVDRFFSLVRLASIAVRARKRCRISRGRARC